MYLTNKRGYLYLYESYRDENGKSRTRQVKSYGREDLIDPDNLEKLYKEYGNKRLNQKLKQQQNLDRQYETTSTNECKSWIYRVNCRCLKNRNGFSAYIK